MYNQEVDIADHYFAAFRGEVVLVTLRFFRIASFKKTGPTSRIYRGSEK